MDFLTVNGAPTPTTNTHPMFFPGEYNPISGSSPAGQDTQDHAASNSRPHPMDLAVLDVACHGPGQPMSGNSGWRLMTTR